MSRLMLLPILPLLLGASPAPPLCRVQAVPSPTQIPGIYTVRVLTTTTLAGQSCPANGYAVVRLEAGRVYPYKTARPGSPALFRGVPWYWEGTWRASSGTTYRFPIPGMLPPWGD